MAGRVAGGCWAGLALAAFAGIAAAQAGERPLAPDSNAHCGPGFTAVPGTRTCLRLGGQVRSDVAVGRSAASGSARPEVSGRVTLDARTATEHGPVRVFIQAGTGQPRP